MLGCCSSVYFYTKTKLCDKLFILLCLFFYVLYQCFTIILVASAAITKQKEEGVQAGTGEVWSEVRHWSAPMEAWDIYILSYYCLLASFTLVQPLLCSPTSDFQTLHVFSLSQQPLYPFTVLHVASPNTPSNSPFTREPRIPGFARAVLQSAMPGSTQAFVTKTITINQVQLLFRCGRVSSSWISATHKCCHLTMPSSGTSASTVMSLLDEGSSLSLYMLCTYCCLLLLCCVVFACVVCQY